MTSKELLNMLKSTHSPLKRIVTSGLIAIATIISPAIISPSQSTKANVDKTPSIPINSPKAPISSSWLRRKFMKKQLKVILDNPNHPLNFLVDYSTKKWKSRRPDTEDAIGVQAGHTFSRSCLVPGEPETVAVEDALDNQIDGWKTESPRIKGCMEKPVIEIGGVLVMLHSAKLWEYSGFLPKGTVQNAPRYPGYSAYTREVLFAEEGTSDESTVSSTGTLSDSLSASNSGGAAKSAPGGIDFSTLELRYIAEDSGLFADRGLRYAFNGTPTSGIKNLKAGRIAAAQSSDAFFVWLSLSPDKFWVNLNPNEPDRIIDPQLAKTDAGRILLQSDFKMKKTVAKLIHPDTLFGKQYWPQLLNIAQQNLKRNGSQTCPPVYRMWIVPAPATVREDDHGIYIVNAPLNVKLESARDSTYKSQRLSGILVSCTTPDKRTKTLFESLERRLILPRIVQAVNTAPEYADLRRVYRSRVAAEWYRQRSKSQATTYREMVNHGDISSWPARQDWSPRQVFDQYTNSYKKGEFHVVHKWQEGNILYTQFYIYGGVDFTKVFFKKLNLTDFQRKWGDLGKVAKTSIKSPVTDSHGKIWLGGITTLPNIPIWQSIWFYFGLGVLVVPFTIYWTRTYRKQWLFSLSSSQIFSAVGGKILDITIVFTIVASCGALAVHFVSSFTRPYEPQSEPALRNPEILQPRMMSPQLMTPEMHLYTVSPRPSPSPR
jgi:Bacterial toxin 5